MQTPQGSPLFLTHTAVFKILIGGKNQYTILQQK